MIIKKNKYENLISDIIERVKGDYYNQKNYDYINNKIVNFFAEGRLNRLLYNSIDSQNIDVDDMINTFKNKLKNPDYDNNKIEFTLRHVLQFWERSDGKKDEIMKILKLCNKYNIKIEDESIIKYYTSRNIISLSDYVLEKYKKLFQIYLSVFNSRITTSSVPIRHKVNIIEKDMLISKEIELLGKICESYPYLDGSLITEGVNLIEKFYLANLLRNRGYYLEKYKNEHDIWSLAALSLLGRKLKFEDRPYIGEKINDELNFYYDMKIDNTFEELDSEIEKESEEMIKEYKKFKNSFEILEIDILELKKRISDHQKRYESFEFFSFFLQKGLDNWNKVIYITDTSWNKEIISHTKSKLKEAKEYNFVKVKELITPPSITDDRGNDKHIKEFEHLENLKWDEITFEIDYPRSTVEITARDRSTGKHKLEDFGLLADKKNKTGMTVFWDLLRDFDTCRGKLPGRDMITQPDKLKDRVSRFRQHLRELFPYIEDRFPITIYDRSEKTYRLKIELNINW